jgi:hypothetical protein
MRTLIYPIIATPPLVLATLAALHGPAYAAGVVQAWLWLLVLAGVAGGLLFALATYGRDAVRAWRPR